MLIVDTHILIFTVLAPNRLSKKAKQLLSKAETDKELACADISLWEIAMLLDKKRIQIDHEPKVFMDDLLTAKDVLVLPININIALLSQSHPDLKNHKDPADRLIAATALYHDAKLMTLDRKLQNISGLTTLA